MEAGWCASATHRSGAPGVSYRHHLYWRYSLVWAKPAAMTAWPAAGCSAVPDRQTG
jgi:hypothetical protein